MTDMVNSGDSSPLVTAVIPYYERPELLIRAAQSVADQSYSPIELIVVDDHSQTRHAESIIDDNRSVFNELEGIFVYRHGSNRGVCEARNTGIRHANGDYIAFLDDDDTWDSKKIEAQVNTVLDSDVSLVYCGVRRAGPDGTTRATYYPEKDGDVIEELLCGNITGTTSTILVSKEVAQSIDGFDPQFLRWNDWDFALRAAKQCQFGVVSDLLVTQYNSGEHQLSGDHEKLEISAERFREKHSNIAISTNNEKLFYGWIEWGLGHSAMSNGFYREAREHFLSSIKYNPWNKKAYLYLITVSGGGITHEMAKRFRRSIFHLSNNLRGDSI